MDGSPASADSLRWAAWESQETSAAPLVVVHICAPKDAIAVSADIRSVRKPRARAQATASFGDALSDSSALPWRTQLQAVDGSAPTVLVERAGHAAMLVPGTPVRSSSDPGLRQSLVGHGQHDVPCPVVPVPTVAEPGDAGSEHSAAAVVG
ncbi:MAG: universal stress protein [Actinomycetota bacterium]|nr:universal stress protein [Actinomycetota bacterium]